MQNYTGQMTFSSVEVFRDQLSHLLKRGAVQWQESDAGEVQARVLVSSDSSRMLLKLKALTILSILASVLWSILLVQL